MKNKHTLILFLLITGILSTSLSINGVNANGLEIGQVRITGQNTVDEFSMIEFNISWKNSWRTSTYESNWDAVWVFVKYKKVDGAITSVWNHCSLNYVDGTGASDGHTVPAGAQIKTPSDGRGVFIQRNADGIGDVSWEDVQLRWNYGADGLVQDDSVEVIVYGIEMVYIPEGSFYLGDGSASSAANFEAGTTNLPFQITSEGSITLGGDQGASALGNNNRAGMHASYIDDWANVSNVTLGAQFPKGYKGYYCMKYEISQEQYVGFLNTLTRIQQADRFPTTTVGTYFCDGSSTIPVNRNSIKLKADDDPSYPREYGCDLDNDNIYNEPVDGQNIACNFLSIRDALAYTDWAGLRPMTEFEYEKACRGTITPLPNEFPWRTTTYTAATTISNGGLSNETSGSTEANVNAIESASITGPMRVGSFARASATKVSAGATYYGVMNMSDNLREMVISVGRPNGRAFTGGHGNGALDANGRCDVADWPSSGDGMGWRGANWNMTADNMNLYGPVSKRFVANLHNIVSTTRYSGIGFRAVRSEE